jgi:diketogulonate reductase-like aldo/keto reductase
MTDIKLSGAKIPEFLFGTAWKKDETQKFTHQAIELGMRGVDTANQLKHYNEPGVGAGLNQAIEEGLVTREDVFLQTKFTYLAFQDESGPLPFDPNMAANKQLESSFEKSLEHLKTDYLDSYLIHGPEQPSGLSENDLLVWKAMEGLVQENKVRYIGLSNFNAKQIMQIIEIAEVKPKFVQNRCYPTIEWDELARKVCRDHDITYQAFNLQRDPMLQDYKLFRGLSEKYEVPVNTIIYSYAKQAGILPLSGAREPEHLKINIQSTADLLTPEEFASIDNVSFLAENR